MNPISYYVERRLLALDFSKPLPYIDLFIALFLVISFLIYLRRFPLFRVVLGTVFLSACSLLFLAGGFVFTGLIFGLVSGLVLFALPLIFAPEIRHYLEKLGRFYHFKLPFVSRKQKNKHFIYNFSDAVFNLAEKKIGALIVFQRNTPLGNLIETGVGVDAAFGSKLLETIFYHNTPLHDGAVVIVGTRIVAARCTVPISSHLKLDPPFGLRHKAGLSATQETDAVVIIVSEQRGHVSLAENNKLEDNLSRAVLTDKLFRLL